jgi:DNA ligase-1
MGTMGVLVCKDLETGGPVRLGTGFTAIERQDFWDNLTSYINVMVKYKSFKVGVKDLPRHAVYLGLRDPSDM